jgi:nicotinamide-nucleotide amidase
MTASADAAHFDNRIEELAQRIGFMLTRSGERIAAAESLTAGHVQSSIASVSGASRYFMGGITAYHIDGKVGLLGVDRIEAERSDCVSGEVARQMARGAQRAFGTEVGIGTTGYADGVDAPYAFVAVAVGGTERVERFDGAGLTRRQMQRGVTARVLELVIDMLEACDGH